MNIEADYAGRVTELIEQIETDEEFDELMVDVVLPELSPHYQRLNRSLLDGKQTVS